MTDALEDTLSASHCVCKLSHVLPTTCKLMCMRSTSSVQTFSFLAKKANWDLQVTYQTDLTNNRTVVFTVDAGSNIQPWRVESPNMYSATITLTTLQSDQVVVPFGFHKVQPQSPIAPMGVAPCLPQDFQIISYSSFCSHTS